MLSQSFQREKQEWEGIQEFKKVTAHQPYFENIQTFNLKFSKKDERNSLLISKKNRDEELKKYANNTVTKGQSSSAIKGLGQGYNSNNYSSGVIDYPGENTHKENNNLASNAGNQHILEKRKKKAHQSERQQPQKNIGGSLKNFNQMSIAELKQHERGILNLYESNLSAAQQ